MARLTASWFRFLFTVALVVSTAMFLRARSKPESLPQHRELSTFPVNLGGWSGIDLGISGDVLTVLGPGVFLSRSYQSLGFKAPVDLFIAYFPSQRTGNTIHSPKNCLPGSGWVPIESERISIHSPNGPATVNQYILGMGMDRLVVIYWYQAHGRIVASEYWAKFYLATDAIRMNRTDGSLVRVSTPVAPGESELAAQSRALTFAEEITKILDRYIPR